MKKSVLVIALITLASIVNAQSFTAKASGGFDANTGVLTTESIVIDGQSFSIHETGKGSKYIKCLSPRTGNDYAVWVGSKTSHSYEGSTVYQSKKGTYCVYKLSPKTGNPYPKWLDMTE
jgi:hypothetical protein